MFTRFHDDPVRIQKSIDESTFTGRYALNTPGPGLNLPFIEDPQVRMQLWGSNLLNNDVSIESDLRGLTRRLNRDNIELNRHSVYDVVNPTYTSVEPFVQESRATHPAWLYRIQENSRWEEPFLNPQANLEIPFQQNVQTRILAKDNYIPQIPTPFNS